MREDLDFRTIFPVKDEASARLMLEKAERLFQAGVIDRADRREVLALYLRIVVGQPGRVDT